MKLSLSFQVTGNESNTAYSIYVAYTVKENSEDMWNEISHHYISQLQSKYVHRANGNWEIKL
jgi:hypothetical protein